MATRNESGKPPATPTQGEDRAPATSRRRQYEYDHQYGLTPYGRAVDPAPKPPKPGGDKSGDKR